MPLGVFQAADKKGTGLPFNAYACEVYQLKKSIISEDALQCGTTFQISDFLGLRQEV